MHPRNRYLDNPPDFARLAQTHAPLARFLSPAGNGEKLSFLAKEPGAVAELVKVLIRVDFNVSSYQGVPDGYLVPSVTRSLNYLHFIEDLLEETRAKLSQAKCQEGVRGLDVGVGSSCIFPILGCALHTDWSFVGIDVDDVALESARMNSQQFAARIELRKSTPGPVPNIRNALKADEEANFDFCMCNPPFFSTPSDELGRPFGGTSLERSCDGGELGFVFGLIDESIQLKSRVTWFTTMLGIKESMACVLSRLHHQALAATIRTFRLEQGNKFRWVVAWSFQEQLSPGSVIGQVLTIDNLKEKESDTAQHRVSDALGELRNFTPLTGICGGEGYRFRLRVVVLDATHVRIDVLDVKGDDTDARARSAVRKLEQLILCKSRKWKKRQRTS